MSNVNDFLKGFVTREKFNGDIEQILHLPTAIAELERMKANANIGGCIIVRYEKRRKPTEKGYTHLPPAITSPTPRANTPMQLDAQNIIINQDPADLKLYE